MNNFFTMYADNMLDWDDAEIRHLDEFYIALTIVLTVLILFGGIFLL